MLPIERLTNCDEFVAWVCQTCDSLSLDEEKEVADLLLRIPTLLVMRDVNPHILIKEIAQSGDLPSGYIQNVHLLIRTLAKINYRRLDELSVSDIIKLFDSSKKLRSVSIVFLTLHILKYKYLKEVMSEFVSMLPRYISGSNVLDLAAVVNMMKEHGIKLDANYLDNVL